MKLKCSNIFWIMASVNDLHQPKILMPSNILKEHSCRCSCLIAFPNKIWYHMWHWNGALKIIKYRAVISMINRINYSTNPPFTNMEFLWLDHWRLEQTFTEDLKLGTKFRIRPPWLLILLITNRPNENFRVFGHFPQKKTRPDRTLLPAFEGIRHPLFLPCILAIPRFIQNFNAETLNQTFLK